MKKNNSEFHIALKGGIDLDKTERSGQCFRWIREEDGSFLIPALGMLFKAAESGDGIDVTVLGTSGKKTPDAAKMVVSEYFDVSLDYEKIRKMPDAKDKFLKRAAKSGEGIRIIKQDPFETLITFIISQRKSIPSIKTSVERICRAVGRKIPGTDIYDFPTPEELSKLDEKILSECGLGYRVSYIRSASEKVYKGDVDPGALALLNDEELLQSLMELNGVGIKVANCTALFGFHRLDLFPIDVWIKRALDEHYGGTFPLEKYHPYNGIMQQFIFALRGDY